ncbi:MAG TPA: periplasmic heavy metal sensor [Terriglobia bacterium]|nr:periplasmic heavy metal sensor [Terriglobia bacterium]
MKRILFTVLITGILSAGLLAQGRRGGPPPDPTATLKAALNLTDAQVDSVKALFATRQQQAEAIRTDIQQKRQALDAFLNVTSPNPADVGNAAIALRASENKLAAERDWFLTELKKLVTGAQQQTLDNLIAARTPIPLLGPGGPGRGPRPRP